MSDQLPPEPPPQGPPDQVLATTPRPISVWRIAFGVYLGLFMWTISGWMLFAFLINSMLGNLWS